MEKIDYDGYRFPPAIIQQAIWLCFRLNEPACAGEAGLS
jgi:hypothetical protein